MEEVKRKPWQSFWTTPAPFFLLVVFIILGYGLMFYIIPKALPTGYVQIKPEQKPLIERQTVTTAAGPVEIIDLRSGTEFNRIIAFPNGRYVVEGGYVNSLGEQRIRIIGREQDP